MLRPQSSLFLSLAGDLESLAGEPPSQSSVNPPHLSFPHRPASPSPSRPEALVRIRNHFLMRRRPIAQPRPRRSPTSISGYIVQSSLHKLTLDFDPLHHRRLTEMAANLVHQSSLIQKNLSIHRVSLKNHPLGPAAVVNSTGLGVFCKNTGVSVKVSNNVAVPTSANSVPRSKKIRKNPIVVIDNYDSFTYNLCQYLGELGCDFEVYRNDELTVEELKRSNPRGVLISPGPGTPQDSGISLETVRELGPIVPLFGVCMGLQCIGEAFGGKVVRSPHGVMHGKSSPVYYDEKGEPGLFFGLSNPFTAGRYHSLVIEKESFPDELEITAWTEDGLIMAARHKKYKHMQGVQFHPESIITDEGKKIVGNFIQLVERKEVESQE